MRKPPRSQQQPLAHEGVVSPSVHEGVVSPSAPKDFVLRVQKGQRSILALERIRILFQQAEEQFPRNKHLSQRYVTLARKIAMKVKLRMPRELKRRYCKHCSAYLMPGVNARVRTRQGKVVISCLECKKFMRIPVR